MSLRYLIIFLLFATTLIDSPKDGKSEQLVTADRETRKIAYDRLIVEKDIIPTTLSNIIRQEPILAVNDWSLNTKEYTCVIVEVAVGKELSEVRKLNFYEKKEKRLIKRYSFATTDWFLSMYPLKDTNGNLLTIWGGGSAYHFVIFSSINNELKITFKGGSYSMPEILDIDNDGAYEILLTDGKLLMDTQTKKIISYPKNANLYKFNGTSYISIWNGSWKNRFLLLSKKK